MTNGQYLQQMCFWYGVTIAIEATVLLFALSRRHPVRHRLFAGVWLTACTYPIVWLVFPHLFDPNTQRALYTFVAETFAPVAECFLFWLAFGNADPRTRKSFIQDMAAIVAANLASFLFGGWLQVLIGALNENRLHWKWLEKML